MTGNVLIDYRSDGTFDPIFRVVAGEWVMQAQYYWYSPVLDLQGRTLYYT